MNTKATVYLETTIPSYLSAKTSNNLIVAGEQMVTRQWWETRKDSFQLYISDLVIQESSKGDASAAQRRLELCNNLSLLEIDEDVISLTQLLLRSGLFPPKASADAGHIAVASKHSIDYLLTWNCKHIASAQLIRRISNIVSVAGYYVPLICTPTELFEGQSDDR